MHGLENNPRGQHQYHGQRAPEREISTVITGQRVESESNPGPGTADNGTLPPDDETDGGQTRNDKQNRGRLHANPCAE
jgi:hypothetical protein